jgi:hypothetical protein
MTSQINPNNIDGSYPVAGQDNSSQGFRDNFTNIKVNFQYAEDELNDLQSKVVLKAALTGTTLDNNMNDALIYAATIQDFGATKVSASGTSGSITINYVQGHYQTISTTGSISLAFSGFPTSGVYGYLKLQIQITNVAHTVTLPAAVSLGTGGLQGYSGGVITFASTGTYEFGFGSYDGGSTITIFDLNRALTNFTGSDLQLDDITATGTANITGNVNGGNLRTAGQVTATGNVTGGNVSTGGVVIATGNITGGNVNTTGQVSAIGNVTGGNVRGFVRPSSGVASAPPVQFTSGTNTSVAAAGAMEYDGTVFYATPSASQRGVLPTEYFVALASNYLALDSSSPQKVFNTPANGALTLAGNTTYFMEGQYIITRGLGTNAHTFGILFDTGGTAVSSIAYVAEVTDGTSNALATPSKIYATLPTETVLTASSANANQYITVYFRGILRVGTALTLTPQFKYDAAPGGAPTVLANSFFKLVPVGNNSVTSVGNWS